MTYKQKIIFLGSTAVFLTLVYALTLILDPARIKARNDRFTWLSAVSREEADKIEITRSEDKVELVQKNGVWYVLLESIEIPARQGRVDDLFRLLTNRGSFPRRGSSAAGHSALGLDGSSRLVIRGGAGIPLLDLFVGIDDPSGKEVFLRKNGENEFRSGDRLIGSYVNGERTTWYNLRLFEERTISQVQRIQVLFSGYKGLEIQDDEEPPVDYRDFTITRNGENWVMDGIILDRDKTEAWIQDILEAHGDDVLTADDLSSFFDPIARIRVELGDGSVLDLQIEKAGQNGKSPVIVSGKPYLFVLPQRTVIRLLRETGHFL
ncbi:MAG: DUF4340 domain-containing protein [Treponema sp.]|nr:DUF4340 domain-containing protein [Treponema sp.]